MNAKKFGAVGNGATDDTLAIQEAIDFAAKKGTSVFLPKGFYRISKTLNLTCLGLVGTARSLTVLMPISDGLIKSRGDTAVPIFMKDGDVKIISMLSIVTWEHLDDVHALHWKILTLIQLTDKTTLPHMSVFLVFQIPHQYHMRMLHTL